MRLVVEDQELVVSEGKLCVSVPLVIGELDFKDAGGEGLNDSADLTAEQTLFGQIDGEGDDIEQLNVGCHNISYST